jgi:lipoprotein-anchoring transpeptidase ErfK/SrfK
MQCGVLIARNRRAAIGAVLAALVGPALGGCVTSSDPNPRTSYYPGASEQSSPGGLDPAYVRTVVTYPTPEPPGTIIVDPGSHYLYLVQEGGKAMRYGVGVGAEGFLWSGLATVHTKQEWPDWYPPAEMLARKPELREHMVQLQSGIGMPGGPDNPIGARAMYLWQGKKDTLYRIHGTNDPTTIGHNISSGCIRLTNDDVTDLYNRVTVGTKVVVLATANPAANPALTQ